MINTSNSTDQLLQQAIPIVPVAVVPDIDALRHQLNRRRRRKMVLASSIGGTVVALLIMFTLLPRNEVDPGIAALPNSHRPQIVTTVPSLDVHDDHVAGEVDESADFQVFARVLGQMPVFGIDRNTQRMHHVGWIESETTVPVDLKNFSADQQQSIKAVLYETSDENRKPLNL